jgi:hypothetical protein
MFPHLRRPFVGDEIPTGHGSVFHFLDIFALGCGLEALAGLHKGDPLWVVIAWVSGAVAFHLLGTQWPQVKARLDARSAVLVYWSVRAASVLAVGYGLMSVVFFLLQLRSDLDAYVMPRAITAKQADMLRQTLMGRDPGIPIEVFVNQTDGEAMEYASQLTNAIKAAGWDARFQPLNPWETGPSAKHYEGGFYNIYLALDQGVSIRVSGEGQHPNDPRHPGANTILQEAFQKAGNISNGGGGAAAGPYSVSIEVGRRPLAIRSPTMRSQIGDWIMRHWIMVPR